VPHICLLVERISCAAHGGETGKKLEQAMLALVLEYSKLMLLFVLIGTAVTLSRSGARQKQAR
jgi:hypothetical protein